MALHPTYLAEPGDEENDAALHQNLRLSPDDAIMLWGILQAFQAERIDDKARQWSRLERIIFDLQVMIRSQGKVHV